MTPYEEQLKTFNYTLPGDWQVVAGKSNYDNDLLSIKLSHDNDYWFHINGMPGSHVILKHKANEKPNRETLYAAAAIAAYHSKARTAGKVAVSQTLIKNVSKPKGAKTGTVQIRQQKIIKVKPAIPEKQTD